MYRDPIIKEAQFIEGFIEQIKDNVNFKEKPFETLFSVFGVSLLWKSSWILGVMGSIAQILGFGPGEIGKLIDDAFKQQGAKNVHEMNLSQSNAKGVAESVVGTLSSVIDSGIDRIKSAFANDLKEVKIIKGNVSNNDKYAIFYSVALNNGFNKTAKISHFKRFLGLWKSGKRMNAITEVLMKLIWSFLKGLTILGITGGVASTFGVKPKRKEEPIGEEGVFRTEKDVYGPGTPSHLKYYSNVSNDVKRTLIEFLDATIANFSTGFMQAQRIANPSKPPIPIERAPGWVKILSDIERYNWGSIRQINNLSAFVAPKLKNIAQTLLSSVSVSGVKIEKIQEQPIPEKKEDEKLEKLLQGAHI